MTDTIAKQIEDIWMASVNDLIVSEDLKTALNYEPADIDRLGLPLLTMYYLLPSGAEATTSETGPGEEVDHRWAIYLYVKLLNWKDAQYEMRDLSWKVVQNFRAHRLDYSDAAIGIYARTLTRSNPPMPAEAAKWFRAAWELRVTAQELG